MLTRFHRKAIFTFTPSGTWPAPLRHMSKRKSLKYAKFGEPGDVLEICEEDIPCLKEKEILVKVLAAPINPADINTIQGRYPVKPKLPAMGGNEFVGEVEWAGKEVKGFKVGDKVIPRETGIGTWTSHGVYTANQIMKLEHSIGIAEAATITVNPCTAYRMLKDFVKLEKGDTIIQNGANSAVGQAVHQLCKAWGLKSVGVVRNRKDLPALKDHLICMGATAVLTDEEIDKTLIFRNKTLRQPKLALNCIGGKSAIAISRHLASKGYHVTYGGMSMQPVVASTAYLIFKDIRFHGFWVTRWTNANLDSAERKKMLNEICKLMLDGKFRAPPYEIIPLSKYKEAVESILGTKGPKGKKLLLDFQQC